MKHEKESWMVKEIIERKKKGILKVNEEYQRGPVWRKQHERLFIDSLMRGYPLPLIYLHHKFSGDERFSANTLYVIDGQQRINALYKFAEDGFRLPSHKETSSGVPRYLAKDESSWEGKTYNSLSSDDKAKFLGAKLDVALINTEDDNEVRELFVRLQSGMPLNAQEKRDAWPGEFSKYIISVAGKEGLKEGHEFFGKVLGKKKSKRGGARNRQTCAQIFMTFYTRRERGNIDTFLDLSSKQIDEFYRHKLDFDPNDPVSYADRFNSVLDNSVKIFNGWKGPELQMHSAFHVVLLIDSLMDDFVPNWMDRFPKALEAFLKRVSVAVQEKNPMDEFWAKYGSLTRTSSASKSVIRDRHLFFMKKMIEKLQPLTRKDPNRAFSSAERELLYYSSDYSCSVCQGTVSWQDAEAHHKIPHSKGGITNLENAALVHRQCHPRGKNLQIETIDYNVPWEIEEEDQIKVRTKQSYAVKLSHLYKSGLLPEKSKFVYITKDKVYEADFISPDIIKYKVDGLEKTTKNPSRALVDMVKYSVNGWKNWIAVKPNGDNIALLELRKIFLESQISTDIIIDDDLLEDDDE